MLRQYQSECIDALSTAHKEGVAGNLVSLPTGSGKTLIAGHLTKHLSNRKTLFLVGSEELVWQASSKFSAINPGIPVGVEKAEYTADPDRDGIVVASVQSLSRKNRLNRFRPDTFRIIGMDEAHHFVADGMYADILRHFHALKSERDFDPETLLYGVTATTSRTDGIGLEAGFSKVTFTRSMLELMRQGQTINGKLFPYLCDIRAFRIDSYADLSDVHIKSGDLDITELEHAVDNQPRNKIVVENYQKLGEGLPAFAFTCSVAHACHLSEEFNKRGTTAAVMSGETPPAERRRLFDAFDRRELRVICSCSVLSEGVDRERASVAIMARPHVSSLPFIQKVGRVVRPSPSPEAYAAMIAEGRRPDFQKPYAIVLDFVDQASRHSLLTVPSIFGLRNLRSDGSTMLETLTETEKLEESSGLDLRDRRSIREMRSAVEQTELFSPPTVPPEISRYSKLSWLRTSPGHYCLSLMGNRSVRIAENQLGQYEVFTFDTGIRHHRWTSDSLAGALHDAEKHFVPQREIAVLRDSAAWHRDCCTPEQAAAVFRADSRVRIAHKDSRNFYEYAKAEFGRGNQSYSKGSMSRIISSFAAARPAWLSARIAAQTGRKT